MYYLIFTQDILILLKFLLTTQRLAAVATSISPAIVRSKRQLILKNTRVYLYPSSWTHSLVHARLWGVLNADIPG